MTNLVSQRFSEDKKTLAFAAAVIVFLLSSSAASFTFLGFSITGWAWLGGLTGAMLVLAIRTKRLALPFFFWMPWFLLVLVYAFAGFDNAIQSATQIICPIFVGLAASTLRPGEAALSACLRFIRFGAILFLAVLLVLRVPMLFLGRLPEVTGLAPEAISSLVFQSVFLCAFLVKRQKIDLVLYLCTAVVPVIAMTRGPILASLLLGILVLAPLAIRLRLLVAVVAVVTALALFHTDRVQRKMFSSGSGTLADLRWDNPDLSTSGRQPMWDELKRGIADNPWFGHGGNADAARLISAGFRLYLPHNDWLRILYNYGRVGCGLYILAMVGQMLHGLYMARRASPTGRILFFAALSAFVPYVTLMMTDNILIYAPFFGNLHFLILGLAYGSLAAAPSFSPSSKSPVSVSGPTWFFRRPKPVFASPGYSFGTDNARQIPWLRKRSSGSA